MKLRNKKTGDIFDAIIREKSDDDKKYSIIVCDFQKYQKVSEPLLILGEYDSLSKLNEDWEDCKPSEPLIKDEKIRKAVRAWAEANGAWLLVAVSSYRIEISQVDAEILFNDPVFKDLPCDRQLTIEELCGEEEE